MSNFQEEIYFRRELCCKPAPFIGVFGLDVTKNATHRLIWDSFVKNPNHLPLFIKNIAANHSFPIVKPKKPSYERYIPKGILKKSWMKKHLFEIPAVAAILFDLNWDDPQWEHNKSLCIQKVQEVRAHLGGLGSKIALILIQRVAPLPPGEDGRSIERASALCSACDIPNKQLYVLPHDEHMKGCISRLQNALLELAKSYYLQEIKLVRNHKDHLNKTTHRYLFVRHNFKMGFFSELKQEDRAARSFYEMAYNSVKEIRMTDTNLHEIKCVAGFINYKFCALMFRLSEPRDAITQLKSHIRLYKPVVGPNSLLFEHYTWLATQYAAFADLFNEAIGQGLSAMQTEHPGIYYKNAALCAIQRKQSCQETCLGVDPSSDVSVTAVEFFGQRGWRAGKLSAEPLDPEAENRGIHALQATENTVNHSSLIIGYLGNAISQYKSFRCPRMRLQLLGMMAQEYRASKDYGKALTLLTHMLWDYRNEHWWNLLASLLELGVISSYLSASVQDYASFGLEALGPHISLPEETKLTVYHNLLALMNSNEIKPHVGGTEEETTQAKELWKTSPNTELAIDMCNVKCAIEVRFKFNQSEYQIGQNIDFTVSIRSFFPGDIFLDDIKVNIVSDNNYSEEISVSSGKLIKIASNEICTLDCSANIKMAAGCKISVGAVTMTLCGEASVKKIVVKILPTFDSKTVVPEEFYKMRSRNVLEDSSTTQNFAFIAAPKANVKIEVFHFSPALLGEQFPIAVTINNCDNFCLYNPVLEVKLVQLGDEPSSDPSTRLSDEKETSISPGNIKVLLDAIPSAQSARTTVFLKGYSSGERNLSFTLTYSHSDDVGVPNKMASAITEQSVIQVVKPFEVSSEILTTKFEAADYCYTHETFLLCTDVLVTSPCPIVIQHSTLELGLLVEKDCKTLSSYLAGVTLKPGDTGRDIFPLRLLEARAQPVAVGTYVLQWSREGSDVVNSSSITLSTVRCLPSVLSISVSLPAHGRVRTPMTIEYTLYNRTSTLLQLDMHIDASDAFMFAGQRQAQLRLLPESERKLQYNLYPLLSGLLALPKIVLSAPDLTEELSSTVERNLPSHVYVMPQEKNSGVGL